MSGQSIAPLLAAIETELKELAQRAEEGFDIAPARRARIEGMAAAALAQGADAQQLMASCRRVLPADASVILAADTRALQIDIWQRRAPVVPTTSE